MTWLYKQTTGELLHDGAHVGFGYSGNGHGLNNPALEADAGIGPIPRGQWIIAPVRTSASLGPVVMNLDAYQQDAHGRSLFRMHGDNSAGNHSASHGCIIMPRTVREAVANSGDCHLVVV